MVKCFLGEFLLRRLVIYRAVIWKNVIWRDITKPLLVSFNLVQVKKMNLASRGSERHEFYFYLNNKENEKYLVKINILRKALYFCF